MTLRLRIFLPIVLMALVGAIGATVLGVAAVRSMADRQKTTEISLQSLKVAQSIQRELDAAQDGLLEVVGMTRMIDTGALWTRFQERAATIHADVAWLGQNSLSPEMTTEIAALEAALAEWERDAAILMGAQASTEVPTLEKMNRSARAVLEQTETVSERANTDAAQLAIAAQKAFTATMILDGWLTAAAMLGAMLPAFWIGRRLSRDVGAISADLRSMAGSDQGAGQTAPKGEIAGMQAAIVALRASLAERDQLAARALEEERDRASKLKAERERVEEDRRRAEAARAAEQARADDLRRRAEGFQEFSAQLNDTIRSAAAGDFSVRVPVLVDDEGMRSLAGRVNDMLAGIEAAVGAASQALVAFSNGDLTARMSGQYEGVLASLQASANTTGTRLQGMVREITTVAEEIRVSMATIADGARDVSSRTVEQATALQRTTDTMSGLSVTVRGTTENAQQAKVLSDGTASDAGKGATIANDAVAAINRIQEQSTKIGEITSLVEGIAFQTSLLALNASVEAARAGDAGRGFSVVASEVRGLAQRAADAAKDIKTLIEASTHQVAEGARLVQETGRSLTLIRDKVADGVSAIQDISTACVEQAQGIAGVNETIRELDRSTQSNAQIARQSVDAAQSVGFQVDRLRELTGFFTVTEATRGRTRSAA